MTTEAKARAKAAAMGAASDWINSPGILGAPGGGMNIPPLNFTSTASSSAGGGVFGFDNSGWSVNVGGSGLAMQSAGGLSPLLLLGAAVVLLLAMRR